MNLRYIALSLDNNTFDTKYVSTYLYHTRFISNFFSKAVRRIKFSTDGTFNMINVKGSKSDIEECSIKGFDSLNVPVLFSATSYESIKGTSDCSYYLELLEKGFNKAARFKKIPLEQLLSLIAEFKANGCRNSWQHSKKRFKELDIELRLDCHFTTLDFKLDATITKISTKKQLCSGTIIRTKPDERHFEKIFKGIEVDNKNIIITNYTGDAPRVLINLKDALQGRLISRLADYPYGDNDSKAIENYNYVKRSLSYDGSGF